MGESSSKQRAAGVTAPPAPRFRLPGWPAWAACVLTLLWTDPASAGLESLEYAVKATYLYKIAEFVTWPPGALSEGPFTICIVGRNPFGGLLEQAVAGQSVQHHPIAVRHYAAIASNPGCQIVFAAGSERQPVASILQILRGAPVLTVTERQAEPDTIGIINFVVAGGRVRFEIDNQAASADGLVISSKLLSLAVRVLGREAQ